MNPFLSRWRHWIQLAAGLGAVGALLLFSLYQEHEHIETRERERLITQSKVVEDNLAHQLTSIHRSLLSIQRALPRWQGSPAGRAEGQQTLINMEVAMSSARTFAVLNALGTVTFSNREELLTGLDRWLLERLARHG